MKQNTLEAVKRQMTNKWFRVVILGSLRTFLLKPGKSLENKYENILVLEVGEEKEAETENLLKLTNLLKLKFVQTDT